MSGTTYSVGAYIAGSGGSHQVYVDRFPQTYDDIRIESSVYSSGDMRPYMGVSTTVMYGMADICFVPGSGSNSNPVITSTPVTSATAGVQYLYDAEANDPDGDVLTYSLTDYPGGMTINSSSGLISWIPDASQNGSTYTVEILVSDGKGGSDTQMYEVTVGSGGDEQTPWSSNATETIYVDQTWNYTLGYRFTPQRDGQITKLGGYFNGAKKVSLWNHDTGELLAEITVTASNSWNFTSITPVDVMSGTSYSIGVYIAGSGGSYQILSGYQFPQTYDDIRIESTAYSSGDTQPLGISYGYMYGLVDICFIAD